MNKILYRLNWLVVVLLLSSTTYAATMLREESKDKPIAFPGAEGYGKYTTGGRGGKVVAVTNLNDAGEGSLRGALDAKGPRTIVFRVSGTIFLKSELNVKHGDFTLAGQTAPGDGICVGGYPVVINADNVIIRYMRFRLGDENKVEGDAMTIRKQKNILIDHCSFSWATDECASLYEMHQATVQWCIVSESLNNSVHHKGEHGYGGIWGGEQVTFHHNLFAHNSSRNPRFNGSRYNVPWTDLVDFRNNVIYNWKVNSTYGGEKAEHNIVANYYKPGPATPGKVSHRIFNVFRAQQELPFGEFYIADNFVFGNGQVTSNNWNGGVDLNDGAVLEKVKSDKAFPFCPIRQETAEEAFQSVLKGSGDSFVRDAVDKRIVKEVEAGTATFRGSRGNLPGIIDSQTDVGGYPELKSKPAPKDTDNDGMPDKWETKNGLNPEDATDGAIFKLSDRYTNLEIYLNELVQPK
jgi:pectate lyase